MLSIKTRRLLPIDYRLIPASKASILASHTDLISIVDASSLLNCSIEHIHSLVDKGILKLYAGSMLTKSQIDSLLSNKPTSRKAKCKAKHSKKPSSKLRTKLSP